MDTNTNLTTTQTRTTATPETRSLHVELAGSAHLRGAYKAAYLIPERVHLPGFSVPQQREALTAALALHRLEIGTDGAGCAVYLNRLGFRATTDADDAVRS